MAPPRIRWQDCEDVLFTLLPKDREALLAALLALARDRQAPPGKVLVVNGWVVTYEICQDGSEIRLCSIRPQNG